MTMAQVGRILSTEEKVLVDGGPPDRLAIVLTAEILRCAQDDRLEFEMILRVGKAP